MSVVGVVAAACHVLVTSFEVWGPPTVSVKLATMWSVPTMLEV